MKLVPVLDDVPGMQYSHITTKLIIVKGVTLLIVCIRVLDMLRWSQGNLPSFKGHCEFPECRCTCNSTG